MLDSIGELLETSSRENSEKMADLLFRCSRVDIHHQRAEALRKMGKVLRISPARAEEAAEIILRYSKQPQPRVIRLSLTPDLRHVDCLSHLHAKTQVLRIASPQRMRLLTVEADATSQLVHVVEAFPGKAEEVFSLLRQKCRDNEDEEMQRVAINQLVLMADACPHMPEKIVNAVLPLCTDAQPMTRVLAVLQLSNLAIVISENKERIVKALLRACSDVESEVRQSAIAQLPKTMQACASMAWQIISVLLWKCSSERSSDSSVAKEQLDAALTICPDIAIKASELLALSPKKTRRSM